MFFGGLCVEVFARNTLAREKKVDSEWPATLVILTADEFFVVLLRFFSVGSKSVV